jgi:hypothetical protein
MDRTTHCPDAVIGVVDFYDFVALFSGFRSIRMPTHFGLTDEAAGRAWGLSKPAAQATPCNLTAASRPAILAAEKPDKEQTQGLAEYSTIGMAYSVSES